MPYYNESGQVTIDEAAANADIAKIRQALAKLQESKNSISRLSASASSMQGQTGAAIVEQCKRLENRVTALEGQLNGSIAFIQSTVQKYKEEDARLANNIRAGGGI